MPSTVEKYAKRSIGIRVTRLIANFCEEIRNYPKIVFMTMMGVKSARNSLDLNSSRVAHTKISRIPQKYIKSFYILIFVLLKT